MIPPAAAPRCGLTTRGPARRASRVVCGLHALAVAALGAACSGGPTEQPEPPDPPEPARPTPCNFGNATCAERIPLGNGLYVPAFTTHLLSEGTDSATRALIVVHGNNRNADAYFATGVAAVAAAGWAGRTVLVAPRLQTADDNPAADEPFWSSAGWKAGNLSRPEGPTPRISSYAAVDTIIQALLDAQRFPGIGNVVVAGHSAGGQLVHRLAATAGAEERARAGVAVRYVVTNPSTYLYLGPERADADGAFSVPGGGCADYDDWHYGMQDRNAYASALDAGAIRTRLSRRDVRILVGDADTLSASLDQSCGANLQGVHRFARGRTLMRFMDALHGGHRHTEAIVPGVGHSSRSMWTSAVGIEALFGG